MDIVQNQSNSGEKTCNMIFTFDYIIIIHLAIIFFKKIIRFMSLYSQD